MNNRNFLIVFNPASGRKNPAFKLYKFKEYLDRQGFKYFIYHTRPGKKDVEDIKEFSASGFTDIVVVGGDGTLNLVINATIENPLPISILPTGTGNDFIKNLNIGKSFREQMDTAVTGNLFPVDVGKCNDNYFLNGIGIGYDGLVAHRLHQQKKKLKGHFAYLAIVLRSFLFYKEKMINYSINNQQYQEQIFMLTIGNGTTFGGGFKITPDANTNDGKFEICVVEKISACRRLLQINKLRQGKHQGVREIKFLQSDKIIVDKAIIEAHMDGEPIEGPPYVISLLPQKVEIRVKN
ncbi:MAG: diacylglycerol/lipid kinase family protein [Cyclobacteriaceae bacterium]